MVLDDSDVELLQREVEYLRSRHVELDREHSAEMKDKDKRLEKRLQRAEKAGREVAFLKRARSDLQEELRIANDKVETSGLEGGHLKREVQLARKHTNAAKLQVKDLQADLEEALSTNHNANLRLKIKRLCVKYHPDRGVTKLSSTEVARDLIDLLVD